MIDIVKVTSCNEVYRAAIQRFLNQLTSTPVDFNEEAFATLLADEGSHLFLMLQNEVPVGMLTVGTYCSPTGKKAWIEDVVVDSSCRGQGLGKQLVEFAIDYVRSLQIPLLMLTSNPKRVAANVLYQSLGFSRKETNVYRMKF